VCFVYPSQLPVPTSAARLRELIKRARGTLDPGHRDAGFGHIVLVGHSMGGLLARLQVTDSGTDFWRSFFTATQREVAVQVDAKALSMVRSALVFKPQSAVKTVVFISTPHQGSVIADVGILRAVSRLILFVPKTARRHLKEWTELPPAYIHPALREFREWGVEGTESLSTKHPYFRALARNRVAVPFHSIVATRGASDDFGNSSDGVVPYWSAHLGGAASETLVPYPHGCLEKPDTVQAVMKILKNDR
jgi:hypothetical protein